MAGKESEEHKTFGMQVPDFLPFVPMKDLVLFPLMVVPLTVHREQCLRAVDFSLTSHRMLFLVTQKNPEVEEPTAQEVYEVGVVAMIIRMRKLADGRMKLMVQGLHKARIYQWRLPDDGQDFTSVAVDEIKELEGQSWPLETEAMVRATKDNMERLISMGKNLSPDILLVLGSVNEPGRLADLVASNLVLEAAEAQELLNTVHPVKRLKMVNAILNREIEVLQMQSSIQNRAREEMGRTQREYFLREQLKQIRAELGETDALSEEIERLRIRVAAVGMDRPAAEEAGRQIKRLENMPPDSAEASVIRTHLEWLLDLPWKMATTDTLSIARAKEILDEDHFDLKDVKERMLEFLAVRHLKPDHRGPILCLAGPPGVGKTSLGKSIARAMGRAFVRVSLGGIRDEAEIRGHRRTYVGALPGKIIQGLKTAGTNNPVFMLDEIDKLVSDGRGDPGSALLEALDPEQNACFVDHYLSVPFNLSGVLFIATANHLDTVPPALLDRLEVIELPGYSLEQKVQIARRHLVDKQVRENGLDISRLHISDQAVAALVEGYTREAGLRNMERLIAGLCRKVARRTAEGHHAPVNIGAGDVARYLGPPKFRNDPLPAGSIPGVANGLAWTPAGGEVISVEATLMKGSGKVQLTGKLGEVMQESAMTALSFIKTRAARLGIDESLFETRDVHIHVPAGAVPKDGPSAGVTIAAALASLYTGRPLRGDVAMTGEITLSGRVLPVGGVVEKLLAALRQGITTVYIPARNEQDLRNLSRKSRKAVTIRTVDTVEQALDQLLV